jgi:MFS transporter, ACS family, hexuronate transporter
MTAGPGRAWKWWVCGVLLLATMLLYMDRLTLAVTATLLKQTIHLDDARYGRLEEWFSYAFAFGGILFGFVADRVGPRRLYPIVLAGWSLAGLATPAAVLPSVVDWLGDPGDPGSGEFRWMLACRTLLGFFESGHWPCALIAARNVLSADQRPLGNSILQSGASLGAVLTPLVIEGFRLAGAPWQTPFVVIGAIGLVWVPLWLRLTRAGDVNQRPGSETRAATDPSTRGARIALQFLLLVVIVVTISLTWQIHRAWQPKYLKENRGYLEGQANLFASGYYLVADVGCLSAGGLVSVLVARRVPVRWARVVVFAICASLVSLSVAVPFMERGPWLLAALLAVGAGALGAHPQYYALAQELPARHMGMLSGVLSATSWVVVGFAQRRMGDYVNQTHSYDLPLIVTGLSPLVGLIAFLALVAVTDRSRRSER